MSSFHFPGQDCVVDNCFKRMSIQPPYLDLDLHILGRPAPRPTDSDAQKVTSAEELNPFRQLKHGSVLNPADLDLLLPSTTLQLVTSLLTLSNPRLPSACAQPQASSDQILLSFCSSSNIRIMYLHPSMSKAPFSLAWASALPSGCKRQICIMLATISASCEA